MDKLTLSIEETAEMLGISRNHAYHCARSGQIPTIRFGSRMLVPRRALERIVDEHAATPTTEGVAATR